MCIGVPMRLIEVDRHRGVAEVDGEVRPVSLALLEAPPAPGDWILVHAERAVRAMSEDDAREVTNALRAVLAAMDGDAFEHLLGDLVDREPQLPEHLRG